jgi:hypothetical protein
LYAQDNLVTGNRDGDENESIAMDIESFGYRIVVVRFATMAVAESFVVYQPQAEGYDEGTAKVLGQLLVAELEQIENTSAAYVTRGRACRDKECARKAVDNNLVDAAIVGHLFKLGSKAISRSRCPLRRNHAYRVSATAWASSIV